jgi:excisionase family DNA binding protein
METTMSNGSQPPRTVVEAAAELNLKPTTVRAWIAQRRLGHVRLGRAVRIPYSEIRRVLEAGFVPASPSGRR